MFEGSDKDAGVDVDDDDDAPDCVCVVVFEEVGRLHRRERTSAAIWRGLTSFFPHTCPLLYWPHFPHRLRAYPAFARPSLLQTKVQCVRTCAGVRLVKSDAINVHLNPCVLTRLHSATVSAVVHLAIDTFRWKETCDLRIIYV
jgi:hypothetical protein